MNTVQVKESILFGWKTFKSFPWLFVTAVLVLLAISIGIGLVEELLSTIFGRTEMELLIVAESIVTSMLISTGMTFFFLKAHDAVATTKLRDLWNPGPFWRYLGVSILGGIAIMLGLMLLIVPGIIVAIAFSFAGILVVEKGLEPIEALKESMRLTKGHRFALFKLGLSIIGLNILGLLALVVGVFVSISVTQLAFVHAYRTLSKNT